MDEYLDECLDEWMDEWVSVRGVYVAVDDQEVGTCRIVRVLTEDVIYGVMTSCGKVTSLRLTKHTLFQDLIET